MTSIGVGYQRPDAAAKARGETIYCVDYAEPGMLHGVLLRSPVAAGRILRLDFSKARTMPGVRAVICQADVPQILGGWILCDMPMFALDVVRYIGEPVAAVAADTLDQARRARDAIILEIEETPAVATMEAAIAPDAPLIHPNLASYRLAEENLPPFPRYRNIAAETASLADPRAVDAAFARAAHIVEDEFRSQRQYQAALETKNAVGAIRDGRFIVHSGTQWPFNVRARICQYFGVPTSKVRVIGHPFGGGFGGKLDASVEHHALALSKAAGGRAVKLVNTRSEDITTNNSREGTIIRFRSAIDADGNIIGRDVECYMDNGAYTVEMAFLTSLPFHFSGMNYRVGALRAISRLLYTNTPPTSAMRGVTGVPLYAALELHMDHIANTLGVDRREYRLRHVFESGDRLPNGQSLAEAYILKQQFEAIEAVVPWKGDAQKQPFRGAAISPAVWLVNPLAGSASIKLQDDGSVVLLSGANENGTGSVATGIRQIIAEELSISPDNVVIPDPDTDIGGFDGGSQGSRNTQVAGGAAQVAARELGQKIKATAGELLQVAAEDLELADGFVRVKNAPDRRLSLAAVGAATAFGSGGLLGSGTAALKIPLFDPGCASGMLFSAFASPTFHVHYAEVEVDPVTGNVKVLRYIVAQEVGKVINPISVRGQVQGGVSQAIGYALFESLRINEVGETIEKTLGSYRLPTASDIPNVEMILTEHPSSEGPFGAKGVAEPPIVLPAAVVACAVSNAIGRPIRRIPVTPEDVLAAIMEGERESKKATINI